MICSAARIPGAMMRSCGSCSAWEKTEAGSGQSRSRQRTAALPSSRSLFRMHRRLRGQLRPPACAGNAASARASGEAKDRTGCTACTHTGGEAETCTAGARSGVQGRSAPLDRAGTRTKAREEAQPCTEAGCSAQARQSIQPPRAGALGQKTEALRTEKRQKAHRSDGFPACGLFHIHAVPVPV